MNPARISASQKGFVQYIVLGLLLVLAAGAIAFFQHKHASPNDLTASLSDFRDEQIFRSVHDCGRISERRPVPLRVFGNGSKLTDLEPISMRIERFAVQEGAYQ